MKNAIIKLLATGFGLGYVPLAPGTAGSLWGVAVFYILRYYPRWYIVIVAIVVCLLSVVVSHEAEKIFGKKDCQFIVLDEVAGQLVTYLLLPYSLINLVLGFVFFRFFDIVKIFPVNWIQDNVPGGFGVSGDDIVAGIQAGALLYLVNLLAWSMGWW